MIYGVGNGLVFHDGELPGGDVSSIIFLLNGIAETRVQQALMTPERGNY